MPARALSGSARAGSAAAAHHEDHHEDHGHHGHEEHYAPEQSLWNAQTKTVLLMVSGTIGAYYANKAWESKYEKSVLQSLLGETESHAKIAEDQSSYYDRVSKSMSLLNMFQTKQPERVFHEFTAERPIVKGSARSLEPGSSLDPEELGPRRQRTKIFKDL